MEQTPGQQDPAPPGAPPVGEAPPGGAVPPPPWDVPPAGGAVPPPYGRRLYRPRNDRVVAGVAAGLAVHMELDPIWVRLAFVLFTFFGGLGVVLYIIGWVLMPSVDSYPVGAMPPPPLGRLHRLRSDRVVAGVASGLGAHMGVDPVWIRLGFVVLTFFGGIGLIAYIALWVLMPSADGVPVVGASPGGRGTGADLRIIAGAFFLIAAVLVLAGNFDFHDSGLVWGAALIGIGLLFLVGDSWPGREPAGAPAGPLDGGPGSGFTPAASGTGTATSATPPTPPIGQAYSTAAPYSYAPPAYTPPAYTPPAYRPYASPYGYAAQPYAAPAAWTGSAVRSRGPRLGTLGIAAAVLAIGVALLLQSAGAIHLTLAIAFGIVFVVLGATLVLGARFGRAPLLVVLGVCLLPFAAAAVLVPEPLSGGAGSIRFAPETLSTLRPTYRLAAGQLTVDLSGVDLGGGSATVTSSVALGQLVVVVPANATVDVTTKVGAGETSVLGRIVSGVQISSSVETATGYTPTGTLTLNLSVGCGQITVETGSADVQTQAGGGPASVADAGSFRRLSGGH
ncbi:MAG: PspC domain-containing protein [Candidatus Dormibacteria bacterium]